MLCVQDTWLGKEGREGNGREVDVHRKGLIYLYFLLGELTLNVDACARAVLNLMMMKGREKGAIELGLRWPEMGRGVRRNTDRAWP